MLSDFLVDKIVVNKIVIHSLKSTQYFSYQLFLINILSLTFQSSKVSSIEGEGSFSVI